MAERAFHRGDFKPAPVACGSIWDAGDRFGGDPRGATCAL